VAGNFKIESSSTHEIPFEKIVAILQGHGYIDKGKAFVAVTNGPPDIDGDSCPAGLRITVKTSEN